MTTINTDQDYQNYVKHFAALKSKYQAEKHQDSSPSSPLYLILRKADLGFEINDLEVIWLQKENLLTTVTAIRQEHLHRYQEKINLGVEFTRLKTKYKVTSYNISWSASPLYFILNKIESGKLLSESEDRWLTSHDLYPCKIIALESQKFINLKSKHKATAYQDSHPDSPLYPILRKIDIAERLTGEEYKWLVEQQLLETLEIVKEQESERRIIFTQLKEKYQATKYKNKSLSSPLYPILQKLEAEKRLIAVEIAWLEEQGLSETIAFAQELEQTREFVKLKSKYKANEYEDNSPKSHLYKVLKNIESGNYLTEQDTNFLKKRNLTETITIANDRYANFLKAKIASSELFDESEVTWLQSHGYEYIVNMAKKHFADQLKFKIESLELLNESEINWLKQNNYRDIIILMEVKHFPALKRKYSLSNYADRSLASPLYAILQKLEKSERIEPKDVAWLEGKELFYGMIWSTYHRLEAEFYQQEFQRSNNKWNLANASSHWRKAEEPEQALELTNNLPFDKIKNNKLKSALLTTRGGAFRDINKLDHAEKCALKAMDYQPNSHHPHTLMGAICFECGEYSKGEYWFHEAIKRGASPQDTDSEIKSILKKTTDKNKRQALVEYLLKKDAHRYAWAKAYLKKPKDKK